MAKAKAKKQKASEIPETTSALQAAAGEAAAPSTPATAAAAPREPAAKLAPPVVPPPVAAPPVAAPPMVMIDTHLAAATAAKLVAHKDDLTARPAPAGGESAAFKQMKENLHKPAGAGKPSFLQNVTQPKKFNNSVPGRGQVGRNQTFGADVNRTGVPRRTGG